MNPLLRLSCWRTAGDVFFYRLMMCRIIVWIAFDSPPPPPPPHPGAQPEGAPPGYLLLGTVGQPTTKPLNSAHHRLGGRWHPNRQL